MKSQWHLAQTQGWADSELGRVGVGWVRGTSSKRGTETQMQSHAVRDFFDCYRETTLGTRRWLSTILRSTTLWS